nr:expressed conserved protein [Hymenolepis microstoma]
MEKGVSLSVTESFLSLRLKAACLDTKLLPQPTCFIYEPRITNTPAQGSTLYKIFNNLLDLSEISTDKQNLWNVCYNRLGNGQEFVSFSTSLDGLTVRVEIHQPQATSMSESFRVLCEPMLSLCRESFSFDELVQPQTFISEVIYPAILEELLGTKIS